MDDQERTPRVFKVPRGMAYALSFSCHEDPNMTADEIRELGAEIEEGFQDLENGEKEARARKTQKAEGVQGNGRTNL